jgi:hypothetical protein
MKSISPHDRKHGASPSLARIPTEQPIVRDLSSPNGSHPVALVDMSVPQLADAFRGLDRLEKEYENMSGICATLKGLVLIEVKTKVGYGKYRAWLKENFAKSAKTAERYKRLAEEFGKSDSTVAFQTLTRGLADSVAALREFQLDLSHPMVAKIAHWVAGRGAYQLMLDFRAPLGGNRGRKPAEDYDPNSAAEIARDLWLPRIEFLENDGLDLRSWKDLPQADLQRLKGAVHDLYHALRRKA